MASMRLYLERKATRWLTVLIAAFFVANASGVCAALLTAQTTTHRCCQKPAKHGPATHCTQSGCVNDDSATPPTPPASVSTPAGLVAHVEASSPHPTIRQDVVAPGLQPGDSSRFLKLHQLLI